MSKYVFKSDLYADKFVKDSTSTAILLANGETLEQSKITQLYNGGGKFLGIITTTKDLGKLLASEYLDENGSAVTGVSISQGDFYRWGGTDGTDFNGEFAHIGDLIMALTDGPGSTIANWDVLHTEQTVKGDDGDVYVPTVDDNGNLSWTKTSSANAGAVTTKNIRGPQGATGDAGVTPTIKAAGGTNIASVGTPSVTASTSGTTTTFTFNYLKGTTGATGTRGSLWYTGTGITGTSTTATTFTSSGVTDALVGDLYLNTSLNNVYRCTTAGNASTAKWVYQTNIKGATGTAAGFGTPTAQATVLSAGSTPTVSVQTSGADASKIFAFTFGIPKGDTGADGAVYWDE